MKLLPFAISLALLVGFSVPPSRAQSPLPTKQAGSPTSQVAFLPMAGLTPAEKDAYRYEAGAVDTIRTPQLERSFTLKNTTRQPITITRLRGSCGCETLLLLKGGAPTPTARLASGEQVTIRLTVNLHAGQSGAVRKYVWIDGPPTASGQAVPLATLEVDILLQQSVSFTPTFLDFGKVEAGAGAKQSLTVSFNPDILPGSSPPPLGSASPDVQARPLGPLQRFMEDGKPRLRQTYQVTLSTSAHAGQLSGVLWLDLPHPAGGTAATSRVNLAVTGEVAGAIDALPASVFFGSLPAGKSVTRTVVLFLASASGQSVSVTSSNPWLHAAMDRPTGPGSHRLLSVTLTGLAPAGPIQGRVTVALADGEHLDIPVVAELTN